MYVRLFFFSILMFILSCKDSTTEQKVVEKEEAPAQIKPVLDSSLYVWEGEYILVQWEDLLDVHFIKQPHELLDTADIPQFSAKVSALSGHKVIVEGFYIPVEETGDENIVILSAFPFAQCFFCGQAGVESIIDVLIDEKLPQIKTDTKVRFKGIFKTNATDFDYLIYILEKAEYIPS